MPDRPPSISQIRDAYAGNSGSRVSSGLNQFAARIKAQACDLGLADLLPHGAPGGISGGPAHHIVRGETAVRSFYAASLVSALAGKGSGRMALQINSTVTMPVATHAASETAGVGACLIAMPVRAQTGTAR